MFEKYKDRIEQMVHGVIYTPGRTDLALRQAVIARGKGQIKSYQNLESISPELREIVDKVTFSPYEVRDEDFAALKSAGYSDDAIIEIVSCASLAAGIGRLEIISSVMENEE